MFIRCVWLYRNQSDFFPVQWAFIVEHFHIKIISMILPGTCLLLHKRLISCVGGGEIEWIRLDWQRCASYRVYQNHIQAMNVLNRCVFFHHFQHDYPLTWSNDRHEFLPWAHFNVTFFHTHAHTHKKDNYYYGEHIQKNNYSKSTISKSQRVFFVPHGKRIKLHQYGNEVEISENAWKCEKVIYVTGFQDLM